MSRKYNLILTDPPWHYAARISRGPGTRTKFGNGAEGHYPLMKDAELLAMAEQVKAIADKNCALLMWATFPRLDFGIELLKAWGFRYSTVAFVWVKTTHRAREKFSNWLVRWDDFLKLLPATGPGAYTASNVEIVLLGVRGSMPPKKRMQGQLIFAPRREHSRKPDEVRERIVEIWGDVPRCEMFCRHPAEGWDSFGHGVDGRDIREVLAC